MAWFLNEEDSRHEEIEEPSSNHNQYHAVRCICRWNNWNFLNPSINNNSVVKGEKIDDIRLLLTLCTT